MKEPDPHQKNYLNAAVWKAKPRRCRCGSTVQPKGASGVMWGAGDNALSTAVHYQCLSCGHHFRIGLVGDAIGFLIVAAILGRIGMESLWGHLV